jgi:hypothetical protein
MSVYGPDRDFGGGVTTQVVVRCRAAGIKKEEQKANARLIAAAPDLLASLTEMTRLYELYLTEKGYDPEAIASGKVGKAKAAIAKATGE